MRIHHLALRTLDIERLRAFYVGVVGLHERAVHRHDDGSVRSVWLAAGDAVLMLEGAGRDEPTIPSGSMELFAFAVNGDERTAFRARCGATAVSIEAETQFTTYVRDPDGRRVACSEYAFA